MTRHITLTVILLLASLSARAASRLFRFERSTNRNYICYDVQLKDGSLDMKNPIHVYWIRAEEDGREKELTYIQRKLAFGYKVVHKGHNEVDIHLTAYSKLTIRICQRNGQWLAVANINGKEAQLTKLFAQMQSPNSLHVLYVDLFGKDLKTGEAVRERINN